MSKRPLEVLITREVAVGLSNENIRRILRFAKQQVGGEVEQLSVSFVSEAKIRSINKKYRKIDKVTDVLSFMYGKEADIVIAPKKARAVWKEADKGLRESLAFVLLHGYLHLAGYDHQNQKDYDKMMALNDHLAADVKKRGYV